MPNFARSAKRTSGGTAGLLASSPKGSPGASANTVNSTTLMPRRLGTAIKRRRSRYRPISAPARPSRTARLLASRLAIPVREEPQIVVPAAERRDDLAAEAADGRAIDDGNDEHVADHQL